MKFFTVSLFVLLSSAILGGSFATPAHKDLSGLVGGVLHTVGGVVDGVANTAGHLVGGVANAAGHLVGDVANIIKGVANVLSDVLRDVLIKNFPECTDNVLNAVNKLLKETGKGLALTARDVVGGVVNLVDKVLGDCTIITIDVENKKICIGDHIIGTICDDGSVVDPQNNLLGLFDREHGVLILAGDVVVVVDELLHAVGNLVENVCVSLRNLIQSLDVILGDIIDNVGKALAKISEDLLHAVAVLPTATADILEKVTEELHKFKEGLVCAVEDRTDDTISFKDVSGETVVSVNCENSKVTVAGHTIGLLQQDGSIVDSDGNVIGCLIAQNGLLIFVGKDVGTILSLVPNVHQGVLGGLGNILG